MKTNNFSLDSTSGMINSNELQCIWMSSELITYKLCDKEFDCENCEFDRVFRNLSKRMSEKDKLEDENNKNDLLENLIARINEEKYDNKIIYLKNQLVMKNLFGNAFYLGVNPVLLYMLDSVASVKEVETKEIKKNQNIFTLEGNWGKKEFFSPINFMIIGKISFSSIKLNQNKWYSVILLNEDISSSGEQLSEEDWYNERDKTVNVLKKYLSQKPAIGETLMDGGEKVRYLYQYLGIEEYIKLLNKIFK